MDSPEPVASTSRIAATSANAFAAGDAALESIAVPKDELEQVQQTIAAELFGLPPTTFTGRIVDLANDVIYNVVDAVEVEALKRWANEDAATTNGETLQEREERVRKGINRLETLLCSAVDTRFDQAEVYLLRNTFNIPDDLIPYLLLPHHPPDGFPPPPFPDLPDTDEKEDDVLLAELRQEIAATNGLREEMLLLDVVQERFDRQVQALKQIKSGLSEIMPNGGARDTLGEQSKQISQNLNAYLERCQDLLAARSLREAQPSYQSQSVDGPQAWKRSREAYLYWRVHRALRGDEGTETDATGDDNAQLARELSQSGGSKELQALRALMEPATPS